ncbi:hypothetical protein GBAR_LOCUS14868, partial [Geodia barretti]
MDSSRSFGSECPKDCSEESGGNVWRVLLWTVVRMIIFIILLVLRVSLRTVERVSVKYQILMTHCLFQH